MGIVKKYLFRILPSLSIFLFGVFLLQQQGLEVYSKFIFNWQLINLIAATSILGLGPKLARNSELNQKINIFWHIIIAIILSLLMMYIFKLTEYFLIVSISLLFTYNRLLFWVYSGKAKYTKASLMLPGQALVLLIIVPFIKHENINLFILYSLLFITFIQTIIFGGIELINISTEKVSFTSTLLHEILLMIFGVSDVVIHDYFFEPNNYAVYSQIFVIIGFPLAIYNQLNIDQFTNKNLDDVKAFFVRSRNKMLSLYLIGLALSIMLILLYNDSITNFVSIGWTSLILLSHFFNYASNGSGIILLARGCTSLLNYVLLLSLFLGFMLSILAFQGEFTFLCGILFSYSAYNISKYYIVSKLI